MWTDYYGVTYPDYVSGDGAEATVLTVRNVDVETGDEDAARGLVGRVDDAPVHLEGLGMHRSGGGTLVRGQVVGNEADPGSVVRVRFLFYGPEGLVEARTVSLPAPPRDGESPFEVSIPGRADSYRYELVRDAAGGGSGGG